MKSCPICSHEPSWHYCRNVSYTKKELHFAFCGCAHAADFAGTRFVPVLDAEREAYEMRWDAQAEVLFANYTERWPEPSRIAFRARIWKAPLPGIQPELIEYVRTIAPTPAAARADGDCPW